ncbi:MAG: hypothetical protein L0Y62_07585, partial [Nitrospirae bacterium]|nr:hypothetical protein [Nitrospirota bacterium]
DRIYKLKDKELRVVCYDVQSGPAFPNVLKKIIDSKYQTILIRDARVGTSGAKTKQLLKEFETKHKFLEPSVKDIVSLIAIGRILAKMREGEYRDIDSDPLADDANIKKSLSELIKTKENVVFESLEDIISGQPPEPVSGEDEEKTAPITNDALLNIISDLMQREIWLCLERLRRRLIDYGHKLDGNDLFQALNSDPLQHRLEVHPLNVKGFSETSIVIWTGGADA